MVIRSGAVAEVRLEVLTSAAAPAAGPRIQGAVVLTGGFAPISRCSLNWPAQDGGHLCHSHPENREGGNMARAKVERQKGVRIGSSDKFYSSGSHQEVLVRGDILISCPRSTIEAKIK